jgi:gamma-polyglutamate synthase
MYLLDTAVVAVCLGGLLLLGILEHTRSRRARATIPIRVHVNGTRGKSSVTRLIWAALREAGVPAAGKVTGTSPRLLLPDGTERAISRRGPVSIREQLWLLRVARSHGARAVVAECMAVRPELQWVAEHRMIDATIGVITNVRTDHTEVMGATARDIAMSLANTVPRNGVLVIGDQDIDSVFGAAAERLGTKVLLVDAGASADAGSLPLPWFEANRRIALAVTRELGIADQVALAGMEKAALDPGAARLVRLALGGVSIPCLDARAANDPESLMALLAEYESKLSPGEADTGRGTYPFCLVYNHRSDRPDRFRRFLQEADAISSSGVLLVTGDRPCLTLWHAARKTRGGRPLQYARAEVVAEVLAALFAGSDAPDGSDALHAVVLCGNARGFEPSRMLAIDSSEAPAC